MLYKKLPLYLLLLLSSFHGQAEDSNQTTNSLISDIRKGGHIIYMRHGATNHDQKDTNRKDLSDCSFQRNLSAEGIVELQRIKASFQHLSIPIAAVKSSPYCRTKDTASIVFGAYKVEKNLQFSISKDEQESRELGQKLVNMMLNSDTVSGNVVFVGHTSNLKDGLGIWPKPEGVMVIFQKSGQELKYKGMIMPEHWPTP